VVSGYSKCRASDKTQKDLFSQLKRTQSFTASSAGSRWHGVASELDEIVTRVSLQLVKNAKAR
jgi:hypothetical protein